MTDDVAGDAPHFTVSERMRIRLAQELVELSDTARFAVTIAADPRGTFELVEFVRRLQWMADDAVAHAVAVARAEHRTWEAIAEQFGAEDDDAAAVEQRYAARVDELRDQQLFPVQRNTLIGVYRPQEDLDRLDAWYAHHLEAHNPVFGDRDHQVRTYLFNRPEDVRDLEFVHTATELANRFINHTFPDGVGEREADRRLLEAKLAAFTAIARHGGHDAGDAEQQAGKVFDQLVAWHEEDLEQPVQVGDVDATGDQAEILLYGKPDGVLQREREDQDPGWYVRWTERRGPAGLAAGHSWLSAGDVDQPLAAVLPGAVRRVRHRLAVAAARGERP